MDMYGWIIIGIVVVIVAIYVLTPNHTTFQCPKCGETFVPKKSEMVGIHTLSSVMLKCPHCGQRSMMKPADNQK